MFLFKCAPISHSNLCIYHFYYFVGIMTHVGADMNAFRLARRNWIAINRDPSPNPPLNQTSGPWDASADVVPPPNKDPKVKQQHKKGVTINTEAIWEHWDSNSYDKILKQQMLKFHPTSVGTLANLSALTNQGFLLRIFSRFVSSTRPWLASTNQGWWCHQLGYILGLSF